jgi:hypothetical protein
MKLILSYSDCLSIITLQIETYVVLSMCVWFPTFLESLVVSSSKVLV